MDGSDAKAFVIPSGVACARLLYAKVGGTPQAKTLKQRRVIPSSKDGEGPHSWSHFIRTYVCNGYREVPRIRSG